MKLYLFSGKGGVGKSTLSSAFALKLARKGKKTLLLSVDPAHSLSEIFLLPSGKEREVERNLYLFELDFSEEKRLYEERIKKVAKALFKERYSRFKDLLEGLAEGPGAEEVLTLEALSRLVKEGRGRYEALVIDSAPTGHTLRLLKEALGTASFLERLVELRERRSLFLRAGGREEREEALRAIKERTERLRELSKVLKKATLYLVANAEPLSLKEAKSLEEGLKKEGMRAEALLLNKLLPFADSPLLRELKERERRYEEEARRLFKELPLFKVPLLGEELRGVPALEKLLNYLPDPPPS